MDNGKRPAAGGDRAASGKRQRERAHDSALLPNIQGVKWRRLLVALLKRGARGLNRLEAAQQFDDPVLPTSVSQLECRGLRILRRQEALTGRRVARYRLAPEARQRARALLGPSTAEEPRDAHNALEQGRAPV